MTDPTPTASIAAFRRRVLAWYARERRDLPWRRSRDPYAVWVSEIMLQQTRVEAVIPYYERFLRRFPTITALAQAPLEDVLKAWAGLGYYSRARNLHAAAQAVVREHAGRFPADPEAIRNLPGIGRYTAGAIASIAFDLPMPIVDGNVARVFARWFHVDGDMQSPATVKRLWDWAAAWARGRTPGDANQALMELGALVCTKPVPACTRCPVRALCAAQQAGTAAELPRPKRRAASQRVELDVLLAEHDARLLVVRRASGSLLQGWWEIPAAHRAARPGPAVVRAAKARLGCHLGPARPAGTVRHTILHHDLRITIWHAHATARRQNLPAAAAAPAPSRRAHTAAGGRAPADAPVAANELANLDLGTLEVRWVSAAECRALRLATLTCKALRAAARTDTRWRGFLPDPPAPAKRGLRSAIRGG